MTTRTLKIALAAVVAFELAGALLLPRLRPGPVIDEGGHLFVIRAIADGTFTLDTMKTAQRPMLPGYHALMAAGGRLIGTDLGTIRLLSFLHALLLVPAALLAGRVLDREHALARTAQVLFLPFTAWLMWLVYTDVASAVYVLLGYWLWRRGLPWPAAGALLVAVFVRQNNAVWAVAFFAIDVVEARRSGSWPLLVPAAGVGVFALAQGSLVVGNVAANPLALHPAQVWFQALFLLVLLAPQVLADLPRQTALWKARLRSRPLAWTALLAASFALFAATAEPTHAANVDVPAAGGRIEVVDAFLRLLNANALTLLLGLLALWTLADYLAAQVRRSRRPVQLAGLLVASVLYLLPSGMVSYRYALVPFALYALSSDEPAAARRSGLAWQAALFAAVSIAFVAGAIMR